MVKTRTRRFPGVENQAQQNREHKMVAYLNDCCEKIEFDIEQMTAQTKHMCQTIHELFNVQIMSLPKNLLETDLEDLFNARDACPTEDAKTVKKTRTKTASILKSKMRTNSKKAQNKNTGISELTTPLLNSVSACTPLFTPKFDPRAPKITPATGLRSAKPGERFVMMSMSGSPLTTDAVVPLNDGKIIAVTADMDVPQDLDQDTQSKIETLQKQLAALSSN